MKHVEITASPSGGGSFGTVVVDGHDISEAVREVTVRVGTDSFPTVELELGVLVGADLDGTTTVYLGPGVAEQLVAHGWTAPGQNAPKDGQ